jgi:HlyD family secretion protein
LALVAVYFHLFRHHTEKENPDMPSHRPDLAFLLILMLLAGCDNNDAVQVVGILEWDRIELTAETNEPIIEILVHEGDALQAGQAILQLDNRRVSAQRDEALAAREQAAARLAELKRGPRSERIDEVRARLRGADSELIRAQKEYERVSTLIEKKLSAADALDSVRAQRDRARAERDAVGAELEALLAGNTLEELHQAEASLQQADARLRVLDITLERLTVTAPRAGLLDTLLYKSGERPAAGATVAVMLAGETPYARIYVPEPVRVFVSQGTRAEVSIDGMEKMFDGHVRMISRDAVFTPFYSLTEKDRSRLSYLAEVELSNLESAGIEAGSLAAGVPLKVTLLLDKP